MAYTLDDFGILRNFNQNSGAGMQLFIFDQNSSQIFKRITHFFSRKILGKKISSEFFKKFSSQNQMTAEFFKNFDQNKGGKL